MPNLQWQSKTECMAKLTADIRSRLFVQKLLQLIHCYPFNPWDALYHNRRGADESIIAAGKKASCKQCHSVEAAEDAKRPIMGRFVTNTFLKCAFVCRRYR